MKTQLLSLVLLAGTALPAQTTYDLFVKEFNQAARFDNDGGMQKAIRNRPDDAITHFEALMTSWLSKREDDDNRKILDKMKVLFEKAFETKTLEHVERYYEHIDNKRITQLYRAFAKLTTLHKQWTKLMLSHDRDGILELVEHGMNLGRHLEELGHKLKAARVYNLVANFYNRIPKHTLDDTRETIEIARMFLMMRESWKWTKDPRYLTWKNWVKLKAIDVELEEKAAKERKESGLKDDAYGMNKLVDTTAKPLVAKLTFKALKTLPPDSCFVGGTVPINWISTMIEATPAKLDFFRRRDLYLVRKGAQKLAVSLVGTEGGTTQKVEAGSKIKPSLFYLDKGKKTPYSMAFFIGSDQESFAGTTSNIAPSKDRISVYYRSTSSWVATLADLDVTFYDDNCDGKLFTDDPLEFGKKTRVIGKGAKEDVSVVCYDSMKIGKKGPVVPYSSVVKLGENWYLLSSADKGNAVAAKLLHPKFLKTGTVTMKWSGSRTSVKPQTLIIRGRERLRPAAFNIAAGKSVEVPVGEYEIAYGRSSKGKGAQTQMAHIFRGSSKVIKVEEGKNVVVKLGAPFKFDFVRGGNGDEVEIDSLMFQVVGAFGEVYAKIQGPTPAPEVVCAKSAKGRGAKVVGRYIPIRSAEVLTTATATHDAVLRKNSIRTMGVNVAYFPVVKGSKEAATRMKFKAPITGGLIGLRVKKHKMFGKIDPIFK